jgi:hypothetical protein
MQLLYPDWSAPVAQKCPEIAQAIRERIRRGDYPQGLLPGERVLAAQSGVSHMTARKAVQRLIQQGILVRSANGRLKVKSSRAGRTGGMQIALLAPAHLSRNEEWIRVALERAAENFQARIRPVDFVHWDDPVIPETLRNFDGVFFVPYGEALPERLLPHFRNNGRKPLVSFELNLTAWGVPSLDLFPAAAVQRLLNHLFELGHRQVDCLATQPANLIIQERIAQWRLWCALHGTPGRLIQEPVNSYESGFDKAYTVMSRECRQNRFHTTALLGVSLVEALGALRAFHEQGLRVGRDVSVCAVNDEGLARFLWPSLTSLELPDPAPYLKICLEWMARGGRNWSGPLLLQIPEVPLFKGGSTGPAPKRPASRRRG